MNIDQTVMCYISMELTRQALQTNGKLSSNFGLVFRINYIQFFKIVELGLCLRVGEAFILIIKHSSFRDQYGECKFYESVGLQLIH